MKVIKRGQLAMLSISFMIMIAGYLNYKYDPKREENLGQTVKVDSSQVYTYDSNVGVYNESTDVVNKNRNIYQNKSDASSLSTYKNSRDNMISEIETNLKDALTRSVDSEEAKNYQEKIDEIVKKKHLLEVVEGMLKAKGITDIVIVPNGDKYNVIVKTKDKLNQAQISLIEQIVKEEFNTSIDDIKIIEE